MRRRELLALFGTGAILLHAARAQQPMPVIGFLGLASSEFSATPLAAFRQGLRDQGFVEGTNVTIEYRWAGGDVHKLPALAAELVGLRPNVLVTSGGGAAARAAQEATNSIPIIASNAAGTVANFARPGGNLTGAANQTGVLVPKRLQLLHEAVPGAKLVAVLVNPDSPSTRATVEAVEAAAQALGVRLTKAEARDAADFEGAFAAMGQARADALLVAPDPFFFSRYPEIVALAARYKLPAIYEWAEMARDGGLMAYGDSLSALYRRVGDYAGRVLRGANPAELPLDQPAAIGLVVNLKTAQALGLAIPQSILARADEVIE
jgi:putative tryptophan/tyrosine transport system substrate-binding protein